jgi:diguanylate cyclase (GGDEF)-like protein
VIPWLAPPSKNTTRDSIRGYSITLFNVGITVIQSLLTSRLRSSELGRLLVAQSHPPAVARERVDLIAARVRQISWAFSLFTVLWIAIDALTVAWPGWGMLAMGRVFASLAFVGIAMRRRRTWPATPALAETTLLFSVPIAFFLYANSVLGESVNAGSLATSTAYYYLPFIIGAGLSLFPLAAVESVTVGALVVAAMVAGIVIWPNSLAGQSELLTLWRLTLIVAISSLAGLSQLHFLVRLTEQATRDGLTGLLVRRVGDELLENLFAYASRHDLPLSLLFLDLDNFKAVNDKHGHETGDAVLRAAAAALQQAFRRQDSLMRWGGEEFVVALPGTTLNDAEAAVRRLADLGIGDRPGGGPMTASIGIAERAADAVSSARDLIDLADQRMYAAKRSGRNRYVLRDVAVVWLQRPELPTDTR